MNIEIFGLLGFAFAAIATAKIAYRRRFDVLYGPYVRGRPQALSLKRLWQPASYPAIDRLSELEGPKMICFSSIH
jgi:hypothetical protein